MYGSLFTIIGSNNLFSSSPDPPAPVPQDKFHCMGMHLRNWTCSWDPPDTYLETTYELDELINIRGVFPLPPRPCTEKPSKTSCQYRIDSYPPYRVQAKKFTFLLYSYNGLGNQTQIFHVDHYSNVKPDRPHSLSIDSTTPTSISLKWEAPRDFDFNDDVIPSLHYQIQFKPYRPTTSNYLPTTIVNVGSNKSVTLTNLIPFTMYNISLRCKTKAATSEMMWSNHLNVSTITKPDGNYLKFLKRIYHLIFSHF